MLSQTNLMCKLGTIIKTSLHLLAQIEKVSIGIRVNGVQTLIIRTTCCGMMFWTPFSVSFKYLLISNQKA